MSDNEYVLTEGWASSTLGELCESVQYGWTTSASKEGNGVKLLRTTDISSGSVNWDNVPFCRDEPSDIDKYLLSKGDILISRAGSVGLNFLVNECPPSVFASYLIRLKILHGLSERYVSLFLNTPDYWKQISDYSTGIAIPNVNATKLKAMNLPVPPLAEQERIVAKVETLFASVDKARTRLDRIPELFKRLRQSILAAAVSGKLTEDWREEKASATTDTALVERLRTDRTNLSANVGRRSRQRVWYEPSFEKCECKILPESWDYIAFGNLGIWGSGATPSKANDSYWLNGSVPWVSPKDMKVEVLLDSQDRISELALKETNISLLPIGSIVFVVRGMILNHTFPVALTGVSLTINQDIRSLTTHEPLVNSYVFIALRNEATSILSSVKTATHGTRRIESEDLQCWPIAIPPVEEQKIISNRVSTLMKFVDELEARYQKAKQAVDKLPQSILAKALRGELVPTEAELARQERRSYETAEELLARIKNEADNPSKTHRRIKRRRKRKLSV